MSLRIAFDLDGVLADMDAELDRQADDLFGRQAAASSADGDDDAESEAVESLPFSRLTLSDRQQQKLWRHVRAIPNFWETLGETEPGIVARLAGIAEERRWELMFLTSRPDATGSTTQLQTQRWLEAKGFSRPSVYVVRGSRGRIADALDIDVVVDDRVENCVDVVADSNARAVLVWPDATKSLPASAKVGIGIASSVGACLDLLVDMDSAASDKSGFVDRFRRLFGLKAAALD